MGIGFLNGRLNVFLGKTTVSGQSLVVSWHGESAFSSSVCSVGGIEIGGKLANIWWQSCRSCSQTFGVRLNN